MTRTFNALATTSTRRPIVNFGTALLLLGGVATFVWFLGSSNPFTPAGYVGYLTRGAFVGRSHFYGIQRGPTSSGRAWLSTSPMSASHRTRYTEDFTGNETVLSRDNLKIAFRVHTVWRVDDTKIPLVHGALQHHGWPA